MRFICIALSLVVLVACQSDNKFKEDEFAASLDSLRQSAPAIDDETVAGILQRIPSPLEISMLLKEAAAKYNSKILNAPDNVSKYDTQFKKALNLGIYGADLGYANIYGQKIEILRYMSSIKSLADDLRIGQFFDIKTIGRLAGNSQHFDSLLLLTTQNFNAINEHLQREDRAEVSFMLLVGGWIEAMGILCDVAMQKDGQQELIEKIGEQKIILEQLVLLMSLYKDQLAATGLTDDFQALKESFDRVSIVHTHREPRMEVVNGVVVIKDDSQTTIEISRETAREIRDKINAIRVKVTA